MKQYGLMYSVVMAAAIRLVAAPLDSFNVVWDSPSLNHHGSMPLGNGDIALNAWMTGEGDLHLYMSKTDAWDERAAADGRRGCLSRRENAVVACHTRSPAG